MTGRRSWLGVLVAALVAVLIWWSQGDGTTPAADAPASPAPSAPSTSTSTAGPGADASTPTSAASDESGLAIVALAELPPEARETVDLIDDGGPYPYDEDDGVFGNFEQLLPDRERGYYREYTVETPGLDHRGARRIVAGSAGELYWTEDHYASFERIMR